MSSTVKPVPDSYPAIAPSLVVRGAAKAIEFYVAVLGMKERMRMPAPDGTVMHAELEFRDGLLMVADETPQATTRAPAAYGGSPVGLSVYVPDVDATFARALRHGARALRPVATHFYGDRSGSFEDPFGHVWHVGTHVEDVPPGEMERRMAALSGAP